MKFIIAGVVLVLAAFADSSEKCEDGISQCMITSCINGTLACEDKTCGCNPLSIRDMSCVARSDCSNGESCNISEHGPGGHEPHKPHEEPMDRRPGHHHDGHWHCMDQKCACIADDP